MIDCCLFSNRSIYVAGNWDPKTQDARYSCKIPVKAIRVLAGFEEDEWHFNPRVGCEPPDALKKMIWPWIEDELEKVFAAENGDDRITAVCTLRFWLNLRTVILQDAAAMFVLHPDRIEHPVFKLPVFRSPLFAVSRRLRFLIVDSNSPQFAPRNLLCL